LSYTQFLETKKKRLDIETGTADKPPPDSNKSTCVGMASSPLRESNRRDDFFLIIPF